MSDKPKVLITGSGGRIGSIIRNALGDKYELSGVDRVAVQDFDSIVADLTDLDALSPAFQGKDVVVHLAAEPRHTPDIGWDLLMPDNVWPEDLQRLGIRNASDGHNIVRIATGAAI